MKLTLTTGQTVSVDNDARGHAGSLYGRQRGSFNESKGSERSRITVSLWLAWHGLKGASDCPICGRVILFGWVQGPMRTDMAHDIPKIDGGSWSLANLVQVCRPCNERCGVDRLTERFRFTRAPSFIRHVTAKEATYFAGMLTDDAALYLAQR